MERLAEHGSCRQQAGIDRTVTCPRAGQGLSVAAVGSDDFEGSHVAWLTVDEAVVLSIGQVT